MDVPARDEIELNREATFKKKYSARSTEIQDILANMLSTFEDNRNDAVDAEAKAVSDFNALQDAKKGQLQTAKQAMLDKSGENGARGSSLADSEAEKADLEAQNARDEGFIADTKTACAAKADSWSERKRLRAEEIASINQAIAMLRSDDARDLFKKSLASQSFLQKKKVHVRRHVSTPRRRT